MKQAVRFAVERPAAGLFLDPGLGKTSIMLATFKVLRKRDFVRNALIIAPLRVCHTVWPAEVAKWQDFNDLKVVVLHGKDKDKLLKEKADLYIINPEGLEWLARRARRGLFDMLVVDESTKFKSTRTQRFKILTRIKKLIGFKRRYILTGTPMPRSYMDLFAQVHLLDDGLALGQYITHFRNTYFNSTGYGGYTYVLKGGAAAVIEKKLKPVCLRLDARDHLDLPELVINKVPIDLPPKAREIYDQLQSELFTYIDLNRITVANTGVATMRCRQIVNGGLYSDRDKNAWSDIHHAKTEAVADLVEELSGKPALIGYDFRHDLSRLKGVFKDAPHIGGGVSMKDFKLIEQEWNQGMINVLLAQIDAAALGLNLQQVEAAVIFHSLTYNLESYDQFIRRVWRQGQAGRVVVHLVYARDTVDEAILEILETKDRAQQAFLDALRRYRKKS